MPEHLDGDADGKLLGVIKESAEFRGQILPKTW